ncbi:MAG: NAD(P)/FAD-dependent oxidoreductase, partial [Coxiellaceae bacterium]|nr:NAD(P)/FAD-dependent oxidoreductase [Coxiellaceae bacterium]
MPRETMEFDVVIVGAGPSGLSCAIKLAQLAQEKNTNLDICVLEKAAMIGGHSVSGAVIETRALDELLPDWRELKAPVSCEAKQDKFILLSKKHHLRLPTPPQMHNKGNYIISLGMLCSWLGEQAEALGVQVFPGFAGAELLYEGDTVVGVSTGDMGVDKDGKATDRFTEGVDIRAKQVILAEGCHGSLTKQLIIRLELRDPNKPQTYAIGVKELWQVPEEQHQQGLIMHTAGWPLDHATFGGSFLYHWDQNRIEVGFVVGLDYTNPYMDPFQELQRLKTHPYIRPFFENGKRLLYGARALIEGGFQALPKLTFKGGMLIGDAAGFLNAPKIKGNHNAMKTGMLAAETVMANLE